MFQRTHACSILGLQLAVVSSVFLWIDLHLFGSVLLFIAYGFSPLGMKKYISRSQFGKMLAFGGALSALVDVLQQAISDRFRLWKGREEQVDDVLLVGLEV